ncbi:uncharacterized protein J4E92_005791 [Alternaria infectoria]|uniref:uncharacterized protein n=1 Tax=Alternaria hordeiaustralica TaxID=1187925 RepID=UPI0020C1D4AB|nr:uncharacterized protein J4E84_000443 [Alternaria hordeiaustralica]XP_051352829.1 uncharacterized protein J4E92_005791 [Alternaria infectoria]KAI4697316.1 hypothetical protein J4E84_000443 [Alternaria hordeiaustralica]KAI4928307.1 hypothetical protein J4E92_005791 [Alternaria infectoria]
MYPLLLFTVIITVLSGPVEASNPFADLIVSDTPMDGTYSDIDGNPYGAASPFYVDPSVLHMPPLGFDRTQPDLAPIYDFVNEGQPLLREHVQVMDANETMVQPATVQAHVEDTYNPGDRLATPRNRKRQPPRPGGFHCDKDGCSKTFNRQCDLK